VWFCGVMYCVVYLDTGWWGMSALWFSCITPGKGWTCWKPRLLYTSKEKLRLFILQMKCWYLLYTRCTSHISQRLQSEKLVCCRQNWQQRTVFWVEISYTWNCRVNGPPSLLQRHTYNCAAATRGPMVVSSLINFVLQCIPASAKHAISCVWHIPFTHLAYVILRKESKKNECFYYTGCSQIRYTRNIKL
jgi:hypothetical protein